MLSVSLDCPFLIASSVFTNVYLCSQYMCTTVCFYRVKSDVYVYYTIIACWWDRYMILSHWSRITISTSDELSHWPQNNNIDLRTKSEVDIVILGQCDKIIWTMLHLFDDLWLDKIIPKNNDRRQSHIWKSRE
jgi:hypothetical protein